MMLALTPETLSIGPTAMTHVTLSQTDIASPTPPQDLLSLLHVSDALTAVRRVVLLTIAAHGDARVE